jgi:hypothetical protein
MSDLSSTPNATAASSLNPQRIFAIVGVSWGLIAAVQLMVVPYLTVPFGAAGGYYGMAGAVVLFLPMILWLNPPRPGLDEIRIGQILGVTAFLGLSGGVLAAWLGNRFGNLRPIVIGIIFNAVFAFTLALGTSPILFGANYLGWNIAYYFLVPYMLGVLAEMDDRGAGRLRRMRSGGSAPHPVLRWVAYWWKLVATPHSLAWHRSAVSSACLYWCGPYAGLMPQKGSPGHD